MQVITAIASRSFQQAISYRFEAWVGILISVSLTITYVALWHAVLRGDPAELTTVLTYVMASRVLQEVQFVRIMGQLETAVRTGGVAVELLKPIAYPVRLAAEAGGRTLWALARTVPVYIVLGWWLGVGLPGPERMGLFVVSGLLGWAVAVLIQMLAASIVFFLLDVEGVHDVVHFLQSVFAGALIPFWLLPDWFVAVAKLLPFQAMLYIPSAVFAGRLEGLALWSALGQQVLWIVVLTVAVTQVWRVAVRHLVVQGG